MNSLKLALSAIALPLLVFTLSAQENPAGRSVMDLYNEVENYSQQQRNMLMSQGKRIDAGAREEIESDKKNLAKKNAAEIASRPDIKEKDIYFLGRLYGTAGDDKKTFETMR